MAKQISKTKGNYWQPPSEMNEPPKDKQVCSKCGNDSFHVYITLIIDDARLYCTKCGEFHP